MEPPIGYMRMQWDNWLNGRAHKIKYDSIGEMASFIVELRRHAKMRHLFLLYNSGPEVMFMTFETKEARCRTLGCDEPGLHWWD